MCRPSLTVELPVLSFKFLYFNVQVYDFINYNYNNVKSYLPLLDWNGIYFNDSLNDAVNSFYENIYIFSIFVKISSLVQQFIETVNNQYKKRHIKCIK